VIWLEDALVGFGVLRVSVIGSVALFFWNILVSPWWWAL
jgi:hypothetical protein